MTRTWFKRHRALALFVAGLLFAAVLGGPGGTAAGKEGLKVEHALQTVFVELSSLPEADIAVANARAQAAAIAREQTAFRQAARVTGIQLQERYVYSKLFNGFSVTVATEDLPRLARLPGVQNIWPVVSLELPELDSSTEMIRAPQAVLDGIDGSGIKVAIIDTGVDYTHPDLGACMGPGCRVVSGHDFVGDSYSGPGSPVEPDLDPMDENGHGTHVAGIVGAKAGSPDGVTGVAPGVTFLAYKVFGATGPTSADIMVAAMERALMEGADVVNMSIGSAFQWPQYPTATAADRLVQRGVAVTVSAGNSGTSGLFAGGAPSVASRVLAVASYDNTHMNVLRADLSDGSEAGYGIMTFSPNPGGLTFDLVAIPNLGNSDADYAGLDLTGKIALISRGADTFASKVARAQAFGAAAAIVHNNSAGFFAGTLGTATNGEQPWIYAASMSLEDGSRIRSLAASGPVSISFTPDQIRIVNPTGGQVSSFSSWGPSPTLELKPDLGAPGGMIYSTYPLHLGTGGYATLSGTSMAAPHAAGAAALVLQANPKLKGQQVHGLLRNTAVPQHYSTTAFLWPTHRQGAGMIDVVAAIESPVRATPAKLSLGEFETGAPVTAAITLSNTAKQDITYTIGHQPAISTHVTYPNNPSVSLTTLGANAGFSQNTITVMGGKSTTVTASITPPQDAFQGLIFGGWVTFTPSDGSPTLRVPYSGYQGDYQADSTLDFNLYGMPLLASLDGDSYIPEESLTINPHSGENAYLLVNLARQASKLRLTARAVSGRNFGQVYDLKHVGRNAGPDSFYALPWDGRDRRDSVVPQGDYVLELSVLRPMGNESNPDHWDTWTSGVITVQYP